MTRTSTLVGTDAPDRVKALFVERAQDLGLCLQAHVADFVEEERAAIGALECSAHLRRMIRVAIPVVRSCTMAVAEEFRLDEVFRDGGAV